MSEDAARHVLDLLATNVDLTDFAAAVREHPEWIPLRSQDPAVAPLPADKIDDLVRLSGLGEPGRAALASELVDPGRVAAGAAVDDARDVLDLYAETLSTREVALLLGINASNVTRGVQAGRLYAIRVGGRLRLPRWQFAGDRPVPNLDVVVKAIPAEVHPRGIAQFMTLPADELDGRAPLAWLAAGGDPTPVRDLLAGLAIG